MGDTSEHSEPAIIIETHGFVRLIRLNRPQRYNALTGEMLNQLGELFVEADADPNVRVIVMTGNGKAFCSGADAQSLATSAAGSVEQQLEEPMPMFTPRHMKIYTPSICAVNGVCAGAGLHFVADCDIVIAGESASFVDSHLNVGQVTALEPIGLAQRMPLEAVLRMVILGKAERLSAERAFQLGMVSEVVADDALGARAMELANIAASLSPAAMRASLKAIWDSLETPLNEAYAKGYEAIVRHRDHPDALEGPTAFMEKREPKWS